MSKLKLKPQRTQLAMLTKAELNKEYAILFKEAEGDYCDDASLWARIMGQMRINVEHAEFSDAMWCVYHVPLLTEDGDSCAATSEFTITNTGRAVITAALMMGNDS